MRAAQAAAEPKFGLSQIQEHLGRFSAPANPGRARARGRPLRAPGCTTRFRCLFRRFPRMPSRRPCFNGTVTGIRAGRRGRLEQPKPEPVCEPGEGAEG